MSERRGRRRGPLQRLMAVVAAVFLVGLGLVMSAGPAHADGGFTIKDTSLTAPTGIAADTAHDRYWVVNRDNQGGRVFAVSASGQVEGIKTWGASVRSLEAVAVYDNKLWIADIGDAKGTRSQVTVYWFANFAPGDTVPSFHSYDFTYADGAHDAKAMLITPSGRIYLITSGDDPGIYAAPEQLQVQGTNELTRVADAPAGVTDAVALDADRWAMRTATSVMVVDASTYKTETSATLDDAGDGLGLPLSGSGLLVVSSGTADTTVADVPIPTGQATSPTPSATSSSSAPASPSASASEDDSEVIPESKASSGSRTGTFVAIGIAALVALAAGALVLLLPRLRSGEKGPGEKRPVAPAAPAVGGVTLERPVVRTPATPDLADEDASTPARAADAPPATETREPRRARPPGDISDEDDADDTETTLVRGGLVQSRPAGPATDGNPSGVTPRRSVGYNNDLWGEDWYGPKTVQSPDTPQP